MDQTSNHLSQLREERPSGTDPWGITPLPRAGRGKAKTLQTNKTLDNQLEIMYHPSVCPPEQKT